MESRTTAVPACSSDVRLTIIVPAFQEAKRLESTLPEIGRFLAAKPYAAEIVVVDDGSTDGTSSAVRRIAGELSVPVRLVRYGTNRGKGFALKVGVARALGSRLLFCDADLSTPIEEADRLLERLDDGDDVVIASRKMAGSHVRVRQSWVRESMGKIFTTIVRSTFVDVSDITCGFKGFRAEAGKDLFSRVRIDDWSFDAEVLCLAVRRGYRMREIPVQWSDHDDTKVHLLRDALRSLWGLVRIRWALHRGVYDAPCAVAEQCEEWRSPMHREIRRDGES